MSQESFFALHSIGSFEELEEIPYRYRDGSIHYYHPKTNQVYSHSFLRGNWYIAPFSKDLHLRYCDPEEYKRQQDEQRQRAREENKRLREYLAGYLTARELYDRYLSTDGQTMTINQDFIQDIIDNKLDHIQIPISNSNISFGPRGVKEFLQSDLIDKCVPVDKTFIFGENNIRLFDICYNFNANTEYDIYFSFNDIKYKITDNTIIIPTRMNYVDIKIVTKDSTGEFVPLNEPVYYNGMVIGEEILPITMPYVCPEFTISGGTVIGTGI